MERTMQTNEKKYAISQTKQNKKEKITFKLKKKNARVGQKKESKTIEMKRT